VKAVLIVPRRNRLGNLAFHFDSYLICRQQVFTAHPSHLCDSKRGWKDAHGGVNQQTIYAVLRNGQLRIVKVVHVNSHTVRQGRKTSRKLG